MIDVREARQEDQEQVRRLSEAVFTDYPAFQKLPPKFFKSPGVTTYLASRDTRVVGFVMLGFLPWTGGKRADSPWIGDILAIGVEPAEQRAGIGGALMQRALALVGEMSEWRDLTELQLTCDASNAIALRFFEKQGFSVVNPKLGSFASGQSAVRLCRKLS